MNDKLILLVMIYTIMFCIICFLMFLNRAANKTIENYENIIFSMSVETGNISKNLNEKQVELEFVRESLKETIEQKARLQESLSTTSYIGEFKITYYDVCETCTGKLDGITASGTKVKENYTIAADWDVLPPGTKVFIENIGIRVVEDKGAAVKGQHIDVYINKDHNEVSKMGVKNAKVYLLGGELR